MHTRNHTPKSFRWLCVFDARRATTLTQSRGRTPSLSDTITHIDLLKDFLMKDVLLQMNKINGEYLLSLCLFFCLSFFLTHTNNHTHTHRSSRWLRVLDERHVTTHEQNQRRTPSLALFLSRTHSPTHSLSHTHRNTRTHTHTGLLDDYVFAMTAMFKVRENDFSRSLSFSLSLSHTHTHTHTHTQVFLMTTCTERKTYHNMSKVKGENLFSRARSLCLFLSLSLALSLSLTQVFSMTTCACWKKC